MFCHLKLVSNKETGDRDKPSTVFASLHVECRKMKRAGKERN